MTDTFFNSKFQNTNDAVTEVRSAFMHILTEHDVSQDQLASELGVSHDEFASILDGSGLDHIEAWLRIPERLVGVLKHYGILLEPAAPDVDAASSALVDEP